MAKEGALTGGVEGKLPGAVRLYLRYYAERGLAAPEAKARVGTLTAARS